AGWRLAASATAPPGLSFGHEVVLAPGGDASAAGLIAGTLPAGQSPLPPAFLTRLRQPPVAAVVNLQETQAYRYSAISTPGLAETVVVYAIPNPGGDSTVLACRAASAQAAEMRACEGSVAALTLAGQTRTYDLTPQTQYAQQLSTAIAS